MKRLNTIQKREKLNEVYAVDEKGNGGANHEYHIVIKDDKENVANDVVVIQFQNGPRNIGGSVHGVLDTDLLEIVKHRMECFQTGPYACDYNAKVLEHIEIALMYMNRRVEDRIERNVLGTNEK